MITPLTVVYVLTCPGRGRFATMTYLSAAAFRRVHPEGRAVLLTDPPSKAALVDTFPQLPAEFDEVVVVPAEGADLRIRSRHLKTQVRDAVSGDFVYLDVDTLPVRRFDEIAVGQWDVAAVQDRNHHCPLDPVFPYWRSDDYRRLGWEHPLPKFFNSGVVFFRDTAATRRLSAEWQRRWRELFAVGREDDDQFALTSALFATPGLTVNELDVRYNGMVAAHPVHARGAKVWHFFAGNVPDTSGTVLEHLIRRFDATGEVDWPTVDRCVAMDHPWVPPYWPRRLWQTGNRRLALRHGLAKWLPGRRAGGRT
jgi:hypothetical protein